MWFKLKLAHLLLLFCYCTLYIQGEIREEEKIAPHFIRQPQSHIHFLNSSGAVIDCEVVSQPAPKISWIINRDVNLPANNVPNIRQTLANGSLWLLPFMAPESYRQEVHSTTVNCLAENEYGAILSRDIQITAVIEQQYSDIQVYDEFVLMGNTAVLRCNIPSFLKDYLNVIGWIRTIENPNADYTTNSRKHQRTKNPIKKNKNNHHSNEFEQHIYSDISLRGRFSIFKTGELHIRNVTLADSTSGYRCLMHNQLTNQKRLSAPGRLVVTESSGTVPPRIIHSPPLHIYAKVGQQLELPCAAQSYPLPKYVWTGPLLNKSNEELKSLLPVNLLKQNLTSLKPFQQSGSLYFENVQAYHSGLYQCAVKNVAGEEKVQLNLHVQESLKVIIEPSLSKNQLGDRVEFTCTIQGSPKANLTWFKNGHKLTNLEMTNRFKLINNLSNDKDYSRLIIFDIQQEDAGLYQCFASNSFETQQAISQLELGHSLPVLHSKFKPVNIEFKNGETEQLITLRCETSGNPLPRFKWSLDGYQLFSNTQIIDKNSIKLSERIDTSPPVTRLISEIQILIKNSKQSTNLGGIYSCEANNILGTTQHYARLNIPGTIGIRKIPAQKLISGMNLNLNCPYYGYPVDSIQWFKDSIKLPVSRRQSVFSNGTLIVYNAQKGTDDSMYECRVNQAGVSRNQSVEVVIKRGPVLEEFNFPRNLELNMRARLVCTIITGDPPFVIKWLWNGRPILTSLPTSELDFNSNDNNLKKEPKGKFLEGISLKVDEFSADLSFASVTEQHNGNYSCKVSNDVATIEHTAQLKVNVPPYFKVEPQDVSVLVGMKARLDCGVVYAHPKPTISWEKGTVSDQAGLSNLNANQLNSQFVGIRTSDDVKHQLLPNGSLLIMHAQKSDAGLFFCSANNGIGPGLSKIITLNVHSAPHFDTDSLTYSVRVNEAITFECNVSGDKPIRSWFKLPSGSVVENIEPLSESPDDTQMENNKNQVNAQNLTAINSRLQITSKLRKLSFSADDQLRKPEWSVGQLTIAKALPSDSGYYFCTVENEFGSADLPIRLIVQEPPHKPTDIQLLECGSRTARLSWKTTFNGNSEITKFWIFCHLQHFKGNDSGVNASVVSFEGNLNTAVVHGLRPSKSYFCSVRAENEVGLSQSSDHVEVFTKQEAPEASVINLKAEAIDSKSIKVSWISPPEETHNGQIKGYYVGYSRKAANDQIIYKTLEMGDNQKSPFQPDLNEETESTTNRISLSGQLSMILTNLKPFTEYQINVKPFNSIGSGPLFSSPVLIRTPEDAPDEPPKQIKCFNQSSQSLLLSWRPIDEYSLNGILLGYRIRLRPLGANFSSMITLNVTSTETEQLVSSLNKFTNYSVVIFGYNSKGESPPSKVVYCRTMEDVPGQPKLVRALITGVDSALVSWLDPVEPNGIILKFTVYWREFQNNRTKTSITIPRSIRSGSSGSMNGNLQSTSGSLSMGAKYFYLLKNGVRRKYRRLPDYNNNNQYKLSALKENVEYQLWVSASNRRGEGAPSQVIFFKPSRVAEPKILEFSQSIPFRSTSNLNNNLSNSISNLSSSNLNHSSISGEQSSILGQSLTHILLTCTVFSTERVQRKWTKSSNDSSESLVFLDHESDGSLLISDFNLDQLPVNYSCTVSNSLGSDQVVYHLFKEEHQDFAITVQVLSTTYNSAQIVFSTILQNNHLDNKDYEIHYRSINGEYINTLNTEYDDWKILPIFLPPLINDKQRSQILGNQSETLQITDLECGAAYELFVKQPLNAWQSELITFRTLGSAPVTPRKTEILQLVNRTLYIQLNSWFVQNPLPTLSSANSLSLTFKRNDLLSDQSDEEEQNHKTQSKLDGCPIHRFLCEYRTSNTGLWKLIDVINVQQADPNLQPIELNMLNEKVIYTIRITAYTVGKPFTVAEYDIKLNEQGIADYDEFLLLDNEDNMTPINSRVMLDQHTMFSIICSTLILLALGFVLLLLLIQRRRGILRANVNLDKSIYRKVINNGDNTSASLLQSTIAYNRSINSGMNYNRPINNLLTNNGSASAALQSTLLQSTAISSNAIANTNNISNADSNYVAAAALAAVASVNSGLNGVNSCSPRTTASNYNQCSKMLNNNLLSNTLNKPSKKPPLPSLPPPPTLSSASKRSNQLNAYKQSTLVASHRNLSNIGNSTNKLANLSKQEEEITPYATFTMSAEDALEQEEENLLNAADQLPAHIKELHEMHRQLSKIKHQQEQQQQQQLVSASVVDLFKFCQSTPQQFIKQQINDKLGISRSRTTVDKTIDSSPSKKQLRKSNNNLIYRTDDNSINSLEKKLLDEENDLRMFSIKCGESNYVRYCMDGNIGNINNLNNQQQHNQMINNQLDVDEQQTNILTPPVYYLSTLDRNNQNLKLINKLNQLNQINASSVKELNQLDASSRADSSADTCSALYEFSCIFNKKNYNESNQNKLQNLSSKNKNMIRLGTNMTNMINNDRELSDEDIMEKNMNNERMRNEQTSDESDLNQSLENLKIRATKMEMNSSDDNEDDLNNFSNSTLTTATYSLNYSVNETNEIVQNDDFTTDAENLKFNKKSHKSNKQSDKLKSNLANESAMTDQQPNIKMVSRLRSRKPSYSDMQTMLITEQKSSQVKQVDKFGEEKSNHRLKQFKGYNQEGDKKAESKRKGSLMGKNRPPLRTQKSKVDEVEC